MEGQLPNTLLRKLLLPVPNVLILLKLISNMTRQWTRAGPTSRANPSIHNTTPLGIHFRTKSLLRTLQLRLQSLPFSCSMLFFFFFYNSDSNSERPSFSSLRGVNHLFDFSLSTFSLTDLFFFFMWCLEEPNAA